MSQVNRMSDNGKIKTETARQFMDTYILADTDKVKNIAKGTTDPGIDCFDQ